MSVLVGDLAFGPLSNKATLGIIEGLGIGKGQGVQHRLVALGSEGFGGFGFCDGRQGAARGQQAGQK